MNFMAGGQFSRTFCPKITAKVNVDPKFVWLLKEIRYFQLMKMDIPAKAEYLMSFESSFRRLKAQLELIVTCIMECM